MTNFGQKRIFLFHVFILSLKKMSYFYKKTKLIFLSKSSQILMNGHISKFWFSKGNLIESPFWYDVLFFVVDDAFFNWNWVGACRNRWADPLTLDVGLLCKNRKQRRSARAHLLPLRCLSQFLHDEEKINCLENEFYAYLSPMG